MMNTGHEASILRKRIRTLLTDVLRYSSAERLTPSHSLALSMEKEDVYRISSEISSVTEKNAYHAATPDPGAENTLFFDFCSVFIS
ncbi:hypothetical protein P3F68_001895 [Salmonella enterica]|nr:hypothetical protein [Salmonella enterica]EKE1574614.1 hypothetical protein [Salmonella enterica]EKP1576158.1 hypothetical protein [Salmonella enterica]